MGCDYAVKVLRMLKVGTSVPSFFCEKSSENIQFNAVARVRFDSVLFCMKQVVRLWLKS